jgi:hypothetical protein
MKNILSLALVAALGVFAFSAQAQAYCSKCHEPNGKCEKCAEMKEGEDCPKCAEAKKYMEEHKGEKPCYGNPKTDHNDQSRYND